MSKLIDTHSHYDDEQFDEDRGQLLAKLWNNNIEFIVNVGSSIDNSKATYALVKEYERVYGAIGVHPSETADLKEEDMNWLMEKSKHPKIVAIGEIGLDYYWDEPEREIQKKWFRRQLEVAREVKLPVIIHSRDAAEDTLTIMKEAKCEEIGGVIHCFSYGVEMAREYLNRGFYLGIGGVLTFKNAKKLKEVVEYAPMDRLVLETDCPYLAPVPHRGDRNDSTNLTYVAKELAAIKNISYEEVLEITNANAKALYRIKDGFKAQNE